MKPVVVTLSADGASDPVVINNYSNPVNIGMGLVISGTAAGTIEYTFDDPFASYAVDYGTNATWFDHPDATAKTTNTAANFAYPIRAIRLTATGISGGGSATLTIVQAGIVGP